MAYTGGTLNMTAADPILKTWYLDAIRDNTNRSTVLLDKLKRDTQHVEGEYAYMALRRRGNPGVGSRAEGGTLPLADYSRKTKATWSLKSHYGRFKVSGQATRNTKARRGSYVDVIDEEMQQLMDDLPSEHNRMLYGDGTGQLTVMISTGTAAQTTITVKNTHYLDVDDVIHFLSQTTATGVETVAHEVSDVLSASSVELKAAITTTVPSSHYIYNMSSVNQEIFGLQAVIHTNNPGVGNYGNIDRTVGAGRFWQGNLRENSGTDRPLSLGLMHQAAGDVAKHKGRVGMVVCDYDKFATYGNLLAPNQRFIDSIKTMDGGWQYLDFAGVPVTWDIDATPNTYFFLDMNTLFLAQNGDYAWLDQDGSVMKWVQDKDQWQAALVKDMNLISDHCNRNARLMDIETNVS